MATIDTTEAARRLGISRRRVLKLIDQGDGPLRAKRLGKGQWMIEEKDLKLLADRQPGRPAKNRNPVGRPRRKT